MQTLNEVWGTLTQENNDDRNIIYTKKAKITQKEPKILLPGNWLKKTLILKFQIWKLGWKILFQAAHFFVPYKREKTWGKGKHVKNIKVNIDSTDMSKTKCTKTRAELEEEAKGKIKAKSKVLHAKHPADVVKKAVLKPQRTHATGKKPS